MESKEVIVLIERQEEVKLVFQEVGIETIFLTKEGTNDITEFFNDIFDYIIEKEELVNFVLNDNNSDLFHDVAKDIISQLNSEINQSETNFIKLIKLVK